MANTVDIEVNLSGAEEAKRGLKGIGETAGSVAGHFEKFNEHLGEGLTDIVGNVEELGGTFKELGSTVKKIGKGGGASLMSLVPALGAVVGAGWALFETFQAITGAAQEAEDAQEAMAAASSDLQSKLEMLAEQGVIPTVEEMTKFTEATLTAQFAKDRLEKSYQKLLPTLQKLTTNQRELTKAEKNYAIVVEKNKATYGGFKHHVKLSAEKVKRLKADQAEIRKELNKEIKGYRETQTAVQSILKNAGDMEEELSERSVQATLARVKALRGLVVESRKQSAEVNTSNAVAQKVALAALGVEQARLDTEIEKNKENQSALAAIEEKLKTELKAVNKEEIARRKLDQTLRQINEEASKRRKALRDEEDKALAERNRLRDQAEKQKQRELFALRALDIQHMKQAGATALQVLDAQYNLELDRAGENYNLKLMADLRYEMAKTELIRAEEEKREKDAEAKRAKLKKDREDEKNAILDQINLVGEFTDRWTAGVAEAAYGAMFLGESFTESIASIIHGLGKQAAIEALIQTAKGVAALFLMPAQAATHFKSAALFGSAALAAGAAGNALGGGGGGGGGASPSGSPQIAPTPERERAQETSTVFNINFGGAVIYDTKQAAERAMVDRIVGVMNQRNRGSRRLNMGSV